MKSTSFDEKDPEVTFVFIVIVSACVVPAARGLDRVLLHVVEHGGRVLGMRE